MSLRKQNSWFESGRLGDIEHISEPLFNFRLMGDLKTLEVYQAQVKNVQKIQSAHIVIKRHINDALASGHDSTVVGLTNVYCLLYSTWVEAAFLKLIHTPYGFEVFEVQQILKQKNIRLEDGLLKCLELSIKKVSGWAKSADLPNHIKVIEKLFDEYIIKVSILRNKFAHGQWAEALNRDNDSVNLEITKQIKLLTVIDIDKWFFITQKLINIIEFMIETPKRHYRNNYYQIILEIEEYLAKTNKYNLQDKINQLKKKRANYRIPKS
jgi:hypothetical protein